MGPRLSLHPLSRPRIFWTQCRTFRCSAVLESGHNRWSKIKHGKAKEDALKSKERTLLSQEVYLASKYGGPDPVLNNRLAFAIANAKRGQLAKPSIEAAIAKGQGKSPSGVSLENVTIEALLPHGVATILEYHTDSKARVLQDIRHILKGCGGSVTPTAFFFDRKGKIWYESKEGVGVDEAMDAVIEAGAEDIAIEDDTGMLVVETAPTEVTAVAQKIADSLELKIHKAEIIFDAKEETAVKLSEQQEGELQLIIDRIEEEPNLQACYLNIST